MKKVLYLLTCCIFFVSCKQKETPAVTLAEKENLVVPYDTLAIDSFSPGATSLDAVRVMRRAAQRKQDSLKKIEEKTEAEKKLKADAEKIK